MSFTHRILIIWMVAVTSHLPFPVCDGDNLRSWELPSLEAEGGSVQIDIDLVLLGCDLPDDVDDGPVDDDPEHGSGSFGADFTSVSKRNGNSTDPHFHSPNPDDLSGICLRVGLESENERRREAIRQQNNSLGKFCENGRLVLRC